jgi:hypothetical protein
MHAVGSGDLSGGESSSESGFEGIFCLLRPIIFFDSIDVETAQFVVGVCSMKKLDASN